MLLKLKLKTDRHLNVKCAYAAYYRLMSTVLSIHYASSVKLG